MDKKPENYPVATFAGGCFWCLESEFRALNGVLYTRVGYTGGDLDAPSYRDVTTGTTGHAEAVEVTFDPAKVSYRDLLEFFFTKAHDPTQIDGQGVDLGPQYRSVVYYHDEAQKKAAQDMIDYLEMNKMFKKQITTTIEPAGTFWKGEDYHQQYYEKYEEKTGMPHIRVLLKQGKKR
ncbi:MAG: peptide-methionine (S)-S-oxide reductase MsrA [Alphaproteobacteria bacterium]|nr:peptide-methionine (S)-S-oxide reductase MsrA [Alphaproteobacteria bacterium]